MSGVQAPVDANKHILLGKDRKTRNSLFNAIRDGDFDRDDYNELMAPTSKATTSFSTMTS